MNGRPCSNDDLGLQTRRGAYPRQGRISARAVDLTLGWWGVTCDRPKRSSEFDFDSCAIPPDRKLAQQPQP